MEASSHFLFTTCVLHAPILMSASLNPINTAWEQITRAQLPCRMEWCPGASADCKHPVTAASLQGHRFLSTVRAKQCMQSLIHSSNIYWGYTVCQAQSWDLRIQNWKRHNQDRSKNVEKHTRSTSMLWVPLEDSGRTHFENHSQITAIEEKAILISIGFVVLGIWTQGRASALPLGSYLQS